MEPHASQIFLNYTTAIGLILGGLFAAWKWGVAEILRQRTEHQREIDENPDLEGSIDASVAQTATGGYVLTIDSKWQNQGDRNIFLNTKETTLTLHPVDLENTELSYVIDADSEPIVTDMLLQHLRGLRIGARTSYLIRRYFYVVGSGDYLIRIRLVRHEKTPDGRPFVWTKQTFVSCNHFGSPSTADLPEQAATQTRSLT